MSARIFVIPPASGPLARVGSGRLQGNVSIANPVAWQVITGVLLAGLIAALLFLGMASYSRIEIVPGQIALDRGVASILPSRAGIVTEVPVEDGEVVKTGQPLAFIRSEESMIGEPTVPDQIEDALKRQDARLADQARLLMQSAQADQQRLKAQLDGARTAIPSLVSQLNDQKQLIATAESDYRSAAELGKNGFISKRDLEERRATVLSRRQQLSQFEQLLAAKESEVKQARRSMAQSAMTARAQVANTESDRAALSQQRAQAASAKGYVITSSIDGIVTALTVRKGQPASVDQQLMLLVPLHSEPRAELYVPSTAAGFLRKGEEVRLSIDAFPYQTFGTVLARVASVSKAAVTHQAANGPVPVYLVTATIREPWVMAFGRKQPLLSGMNLSARIVTQKRSLLEWLFEPLFAVRER